MGINTTLGSASIWQVQEAKSRFSELLDCAIAHGPQTITRHGKPVARVVSLHERVKERAAALNAPDSSADACEGISFAEFLLSAPKIEGGLPEMPRECSTGRPPIFGEN